MGVTHAQFGAQLGKQALNLSGAGQRIFGALKTYGKRLTGRSVDPLRSQQRLISDMFDDAIKFKPLRPDDVYSNSLRYDPSGQAGRVAAQKVRDTATLNFGGSGRDDSIVSALSRQNRQAGRAVNKELDAVALTRGLTGVGGVAALGGAAGAQRAMNKQAIVVPSLLGAGLGALTSPEGHRAEGAGRGAAKGVGTSLGAIAGVPLGILAAVAALKGRKLPQTLAPFRRLARLPKLPYSGKQQNAENMARTMAILGIGAPGGAVVGGGAGYAGTSALLGKPSWEGKKASVLSVLGGLTGGGLGGLAGGAGGGILGALGGGALGGAPGAGLGILAGGAAGLGAGAHVGGTIGSDIGRSFSKKKEEKPESDENAEEGEEDTNKEKEMDKYSTHDIVKNASAVLAQMRKNAADPRMYNADSASASPPMSGVAGAMKRVGDTSAKMPTAGVGVVPKMVGQNIGAAAPAVQAAGNKMVAGEKKLAPQATGGVPMFGILPGLAGNLGRFLGGK